VWGSTTRVSIESSKVGAWKSSKGVEVYRQPRLMGMIIRPAGEGGSASAWLLVEIVAATATEPVAFKNVRRSICVLEI
jgi:hypothetical protein